MSTESNTFNRRNFLTLGATAGAGIVAAAAQTDAGASGLLQAAAPAGVEPQPGLGGRKITPNNFAAPALIKPKPLPDKVYNTAAAGISRKTHDEHYKLYTGYVNKVNEIRTKLAALGVPDPTKANATFSELRELKVEYSFALGGVKNHELYFRHLGGKGGAPTGAVADAVNTAFGSYDNWKADLKATGIAARGWVWLALDYTDGSLFNYIGDAQNTYPVWDAAPLLGLDVYEHAYFIDFGSARAKYIDAFLNVIDWDEVNANFLYAQHRMKAGQF